MLDSTYASKNVKLHRCPTCRLLVKSEGHECFVAQGEKNRYVGGIPYVESTAVGSSGIKILQKTTHAPNLKHMELVTRKTEKEWEERTKTPTPLPEEILPPLPLPPVQQPSLFQAPNTQLPVPNPESLIFRQGLKRARPGLTEQDYDVLMFDWEKEQKEEAARIEVNLTNAPAINRPKITKGLNGRRVTNQPLVQERATIPQAVTQRLANSPVLICPPGVSTQDCIDDILAGRRVFCEDKSDSI